MKATSVVGCLHCAKPIALVDDEVPVDQICPWCRGGPTPGAPGVLALWERDQHPKTEPSPPPSTRPSNDPPPPPWASALMDRIEALAAAQAEMLGLQKAQGESLQHLADRVLVQQGEHPPCDVGRAMAALRRERELELAKSNGGSPPLTPQ